MVTDRVQFREDAQVLGYFQQRGINPNELARSLLKAEFRRLRAQEKWGKIRARIAATADFSGPSLVDAIREDRDRDHGRDPHGNVRD